MPRVIVLFAALCAALGGCAGGSVRHPLQGRIRAPHGETGYWIFASDGWLHLRVTPGERSHRFQGSVTGVGRPLGPLALERAGLSQQVAAQGDSIQFDLEPPKGGEEGFRVRLDGACVRFDLYLDGTHRPERVHLGGKRSSPVAIPFERCP